MPRGRPRKKLDLVGPKEIADRLGWPRNKVRTYISRGLFPEPYAVLGMGPVWVWEDVAEIAREKGWLPHDDGNGTQ